MTSRRLVRLGVVVMLAACLVFAVQSAAGLSGIESHRGTEATVVGDPDGYLGVTSATDPELCTGTVVVTNYFGVSLTDVSAVVESGPGTVVAAPSALDPGESGEIVVAVGTTEPATITVTVDADSPDRRVQLHRTLAIDCVDAEFEPRTIGYWSTHPDAWPTTDVTVGGTTYTRSEALSLLVAGPNGTPAQGDVTRQLFSQTVAAKLNVAAGADTCIDGTIADADGWLTQNPVGSGVGGNDPAWTGGGEAIKDALDTYNNGGGC